MADIRSTRNTPETEQIVSDKMQKSVVVAVERLFRHPKYQKVVKSRKKFMAHDEEEKCKIGDVVKIVETRPLSKMKRWNVIEILQQAKIYDPASFASSAETGIPKP
mmetsp:Transcript_3732/g.23473  ORF Transcript_3732/g.23473 Transcript_3732/m.23473 type:complete len:106 (-) Transcript_3732:1170-1487(-)